MSLTNTNKDVARLLWLSTQSIQLRLEFFNALNQEIPREDFFTNQVKLESIVLDEIEKDLLRLAGTQTHSVTYFEDSYPKNLRQIADPPLVLFFNGDLSSYDFQASTWGIVGARKATPAGLHLASRIAKLFAEHEQKVVSGLALGIDASAHYGALDSGQSASTLAILGNGLPNIYPATNLNLAKKIINNGGLLCSQFYPFSRAYPANFLNRNRLIAGMSDNLLVIEASEQSGSRVTARYALEQGKNLYVIPGDISNPNYRGSNQLIKLGAEIITSIEDFYELLPKKSSLKIKVEISMPEQLILQEIIENKGLYRQDLKIRALSKGLSSEIFNQELINLENNCKIKVLPGDFIQVY